LEIQDLQKENDEDFRRCPATEETKSSTTGDGESFSSRYFKSQKCIISLPEKLQRKSLQLYSPKKNPHFADSLISMQQQSFFII